MSSIRDWFPTKREAQLAMAKNWLTILKTQGPAWGVPQKLIDDLSAATTKADATLNLAHSSERTQVITAQCKEDFDALEEIMRYMKNHFFLSPPRTSVEMISLELKPKDATHSVRGRPRAQMTAEIGRSGTLMLLLKLVYAEGTEHLADPHTDMGFQVRHGKYSSLNPHYDPAQGEIAGHPHAPEELPIVFATKRKRETITFDPGDSGKTAYFCIRIGNGKGGDESYGPWGPIFSAVIP